MLQNSSKIRIVSQCDSIFVYMFPWAGIVDFFFCPFDVHWIWFVCLLHLSHHVIYFLLTTKSVLLKKTQSFSSSADLLISSLLILCKFHNQLYHTRDPEPSIEFHLLFILIAILFILDIIFYSLNYYTVSDINIELFYYTSPKSMSDCKDLKIQYKKRFCLRCEAHWTIPR